MVVEESFGNGVEVDDDVYTLTKDFPVFELRKLRVRKKFLRYAFIGGMWYSKSGFSLEQDISLPYPFSTYYTTKVLDKRFNGVVCRSLMYVKTPLLVMEFDEGCVAVEFDPVIEVRGQEVFPFISLREEDGEYVVTFYFFKEFEVKEKDNAWLGVGKKRVVVVEVSPGDCFRFSVKTRWCRDWREAVREYVMERFPEEIELSFAEEVFESGKKALWRSYDNLTGSFLQLPWRNKPGFTFVDSSYSLLTYEAVRLHYFSRWYRETGDEFFREWSRRLRNLFVNSDLYKRDLRHGKGIVWYNMTNLTRKGLQGYFYMDCGYGGYPGGQGSIAFHLLQYLNYSEDKEVENLVEQSLDYILSTQKENGCWPMALHQEGVVRFRPEKFEMYESFAGTSECVRALLAGYKRFKDERLKKAALKGLKYLETRYPICYNGLRDIGINEVEAFSAVSVIDAFLDGYELTSDEKFLENALNYAYYTLTWFYMYDTNNLRLKYGFHPISYSITPRLSPYESMWIVSTYLRLSKLTNDGLWERFAKATYVEGVKWRSRNGGLSEGVFPKYLEGLQPLPMEQTFATVEMLNASSHFFRLTHRVEKKTGNKNVLIERRGGKLFFLDKGMEIMVFDLEDFKVSSLHGVELGRNGISFSFSDGYSIKSRVKRWFKQRLRGSYGKFLLGVKEIKYFLQGVEEPKVFEGVNLDYIGKHVKKWDVSISNGSAHITCETGLHRIKLSISVAYEGEEIHILFDPFVVETLKHDVSCKQVLLPVVDAPLVRKTDERLCFKGFEVVGDFKDVVEAEDFTGVDQTLTTNWTHGGVYRGGFTVVLKKEKDVT